MLPDCQGYGVGRYLWNRSVKFLRGLGHTHATCVTLGTNTRARLFVERKGAKLVEERDGLRVYRVRTS